jgi:acyl-CoA reductase-like NAD-dependent aldehyde dehydrogenase
MESNMSVSTIIDHRSYRWSSADEADRFAVENPATGEVISVIQGGGAAQIDAAVEAAHHAFSTDWRWRSSDERPRLLLACADVLDEHADELAEIESLENGKPVADARDNDIRFLVGVSLLREHRRQDPR